MPTFRQANSSDSPSPPPASAGPELNDCSIPGSKRPLKDALDIDLPFAREILAREILAREIGVESSRKSSGRASDRVAAAERALTRLNEQLVRWFGPDGVDALLLRALDNARK